MMINELLKKINTESFYFKTIPSHLLELLKIYFRLNIEGAENIPRKGSVLITPNHSGFTGIDALLLNYSIVKEAKRYPRILTHKFWFASQLTAIPFQKMGFFEAKYENGKNFLSKKNAVVLFPEGEQGNFKPSQKMYQLQEFKRGFVRMAIETNSPIIPVLIIGAEESHITLSQFNASKIFKGLTLPLPLNLVPFPAKWKIKFLEPIYLPYDNSALNDNDLIHEIASDIQELMQKKLNEELKKRTSIYF
ncbi:MAG: acyltransferase family protein [Deltaproteobacteria bacterium]|nr:acyltransferase family protein [Deltaproteobacteria bacterium]